MTIRDRQRGCLLDLAPMTQDVAKLPLGTLAMLIVNEVEASGLVGTGEPKPALAKLEYQ